MKNDYKKIALITGASGYIGSSLATKLSELGWELHAIVRKESNLNLLDEVIGKIKFYIDDGKTSTIMKILSDVRPTVVFHLASLFLSNHTSNDIDGLINSNIGFGLRLIESMDKSGFKNIVNTGTSWQNYESEYYSPANLYAATKEGFECLLKYYQMARSFKVITLKLFDIYGPGDPRGKLVSLLIKAAKEGTEISMSPGYQKIDLVYIDDVVSCYILAADRLISGYVNEYEVYGVCSNNPITLRELAKKISKITNTQILINWGGRPYREREVMYPWKNAKKLPNWSPEVSLEEGISICMQ